MTVAQGRTPRESARTNANEEERIEMSKLRTSQRLLGGAALLAAVCAGACSDDGDDGTPNPAAGSSGKGGSAGAAGSGGTAAGKGGSAGTGGGQGGSSGATAQGGAGGTSTGGSDAGGSDAGGGAGDAGAGGQAENPWAEFSPLPAVPPDPTNRVADNPAAAALGQRLFFDKKFSGPLRIDSDLGTAGQAGRVSCKACHASPFMDDDRSDPPTVAIGTGLHTRNSPPLVNASFYPWTNWGGRFAAQWELPLAVVESPVIMNGNRLQLAHRMFDVYRAEYEAVFGALPAALGNDPDRFPAEGKPKPAPTPENPDPPNGAWEDMDPADRVVIETVLVNYSKAIAAYLRLLVSRESPFDAWVAGDADAISPAATRGAELFRGKANCSHCHSGPHFSDGLFHVLGVPQTGPNVPAGDDGRFKDLPGLLGSRFNVNGDYSDKKDTGKLDGLPNPPPESARRAFRTPSLRGVALTAPYMHAGQFATLRDVIDFYDAGGSDATAAGLLEPLGLSDQEKSDLIEFLKSLTGRGVAPELLTDTSAP